MLRSSPVWVTALLVVLLASSAGAGEASSEARVVFSSEPSVRAVGSAEYTDRKTLSPEQARAAVVVIEKVGERYVWTSRDSRPLLYHQSAHFHYFIDPTGGGYVKLFDQEMLAQEVREGPSRYLFIAHYSHWMSAITFWGATDVFNP